MTDNKGGLPLWFTSFLIKNPLHFHINLRQVAVLLIMRLNKIYKLAEELHKPIIRNFEKEQFIHDSKTIFGVLI